MLYTVSISYPNLPKISDTLKINLSISARLTFNRVDNGTVGYFPATGYSEWLDKGTRVYLTSLQGANIFNATLLNFSESSRSGSGSCSLKGSTPIPFTWICTSRS